MKRNLTSVDAGEPAAAAASADVAIRVKGTSFGYPNSPTILEGIDLTVHRGEILVLIGPSGCGKSTVLNLIAGIVRPTEGTVECFGKPVDRLNTKVAYMTQKDTLLPWRSALDNAALPLEVRGVPKRERYARARAALARVGVAEAERRRPHQLSGGMRSRLSLACALLSDADILLMDEPFAAIDALLRVRLQQLLLDVWADSHKTLVYVTHDLTEAIALGHRVAVMGAHPGRIALEREIDEPQPRNVARFRATPEAQEHYVELWDSLEKQVTVSEVAADTEGGPA